MTTIIMYECGHQQEHNKGSHKELLSERMKKKVKKVNSITGQWTDMLADNGYC